MTTQNLLSPILNQALDSVWYQLGQFASNDILFNSVISTAFGASADASSFQTAWAKGDFSGFPPIEIRNRSEINGANGAFAIATGKIYLSQEFIDANVNNVGVITAVLLEEYGHYVDSKINLTDSAGDEGNIFARLVQGEGISESELAVLKAEDDSAIVMLDGQLVQIEQDTVTGTDVHWYNDPNDHGRTYWTNDATGGEIKGSSTSDWINASGGNDTIYGNGANDKLKGEAGNDEIRGGEGDDELLDGGDDQDWIHGENGNDKIWGGNGLDTLYGGAGNDQLYGGYDNDKLYGEAGDDTLRGEDGNDALYGGDGIDTLTGDNGDDELYGEDGDDTLNGGAGNDTLRGGNGNDYLSDGDGNDNLRGGAGNDTLKGGNHDDLFRDWEGSNFIDGESGNDKVSYDGSPYGVTVGKETIKHFWSGYSNSIFPVASVEESSTSSVKTTLGKIEEVIGSQHNDNLYAYGSGYWHEGITWFDDGQLSTLRGGGGNDQLFALTDKLNPGQSTNLYGDDGMDILSADISKDGRKHYLWGGSGSDFFVLTGDTKQASSISSTVTQKLGEFALSLAPSTVSLGTAGYNSLVAASSQIAPLYGAALSFVTTGIINAIKIFGSAGSIPVVKNDNLVHIKDFVLGEDTIILPKLNGNVIYNISPTSTSLFHIQIKQDGEGDTEYRNIAEVTVANPLGTAEGYESLNATTLIDHLKKTFGPANGDYVIGDVAILNYGSEKGGRSILTHNTHDDLKGSQGDDTIQTLGGDDTISGGTGNDVIDGGAGNDTVVLSGKSTEYKFVTSSSNGRSMVINDTTLKRDGQDTLQDVETIKFSDAQYTTTFESFYRKVHPDVDAVVNLNNGLNSGIHHYELFGKTEGRVTSDLFDSAYYLGANTDVADHIPHSNGTVTALSHYVDSGYNEERTAKYVAANYFDSEDYLKRYTDVANAIPLSNGTLTALSHYVNSGYNEGRTAKFNNPKMEGTSRGEILEGINDPKNTATNIINGGAGNDSISGFYGKDILSGGNGSDYLYGGWHNDILNGGADNDYLYGGNYEDSLFGDSGDDYLFGQEGYDFLTGGLGNDTLTGGENSDVFRFHSLDGSVDRITDFNIEDRIFLATDAFPDLGKLSYGKDNGQLKYNGTLFATLDNNPQSVEIVRTLTDHGWA